MLAVAMKTEQRLPGYFTLHNNMRGLNPQFLNYIRQQALQYITIICNMSFLWLQTLNKQITITTVTLIFPAIDDSFLFFHVFFTYIHPSGSA